MGLRGALTPGTDSCPGAISRPGTIGGVGSAPATWILADLEAMTFDVHEVDKAIEFKAAAS